AANTRRAAKPSRWRTVLGSPSQGRDQLHFGAVSLDGDVHFLSRLPGAQRERVVVDVVDADAVEADDDVVRSETRLLRRTVVADSGKQHAAFGLHVVRDRAEPGAVAAAPRDAAGGRIALRLRVRRPRARIERLDERLGIARDPDEPLRVDLVPGVARLVIVRV